MNRSSQPQLSRNKMTSLPVSNLVKSRLEAASKNISTNKKLRTELRRVMSDRAMKITKCSQLQTVEKINQLKISSPLVTTSKLNQPSSLVSHGTVLTNNPVLTNTNPNTASVNCKSTLGRETSEAEKQKNTIENNKSIVFQSISNPKFFKQFLKNDHL